MDSPRKHTALQKLIDRSGLTLRTLVFGLSAIFAGCSNSYENIDFEKSVMEADAIFESDNLQSNGSIDLPDIAVYLKSLKPKSVYVNSNGMSLTLFRFFVISSGIFVLRTDHEIDEIDRKCGRGTCYSMLTDRVYRWEDGG